MSVFIIAEAGSSHDNDLQKAYRLIDAAKACDSDAVKFQWTSNAYKMAYRRGVAASADEPAAVMYKTYLEKPVSWLESLKAHADKVGIEFMCTVYLIEDIATIAPLVKRFKVSAFECEWKEFIEAHRFFAGRDDTTSQWKQIIASMNPGQRIPDSICDVLHCVSEYPTPIEHLKLSRAEIGPEYWKAGLSDHTANVLTGAAAVAAGARIVEVHIRLMDTPKDNPDYAHSLEADWSCMTPECGHDHLSPFAEYVQNIRTVERML